ncbi:TIGR02680 family protein [Kribbella solani]|uniref:TIGR02680 family protein n=1 Tax=Kribbella solani TaxID=236067 RepID=UPI0029BDB0D0|nr:TIGR02680 family protein [Kribbella solani]MDX3001886.1 TIGR02680 family protein [Kribbella solani]
MTRELPAPEIERWQPLRAGLVDLFYYDQEEFWFRGGRLLLRGNNGTGKSKVLALILPFLLDGDLSAHRVEPDADPKKRMEWNLLLGGDHPHPERLGYSWLEFGRLDADGTAHFRTIGCGLKAVAGRGIARHWFFVTSRRVGEDLTLVDATGIALTRDRLDDALDERGSVYDRARDYRRAVDDSLFGLGEQRYGVLVDLLVQLRQPQLSKRPSEKALSAALTGSLPPLDQAVVADVAEAFRSLEEDRSALESMTEARDAASSFLDHYRRYARIASRRRARLPREAHSNFERISKDLGDSERAVSDAETRMAEARRRLTSAESERVRLQARDATLRTSPEMRSARELERVAEDAHRSRGEYDRLTGERGAAEGTVESQQKRLSAAEVRRIAMDSALGTIRTRATEAAVAARIAGEHAERIDRVVDAVGDPALLRGPADQITNRQQRALEHVNGLLQATDDAARELAVVRRAMAELESEGAGLAERRQVATDIVTEAGADLQSEIRDYLDRATELRVADPAAVLAELGLWVETLDGPNPAVTAVARASQSLAAGLATESAELAARTRAERSRLKELTGEIARLERGEDTIPPVPYTRDPAAREDRPGGPLWRLVEFAEGIEAAERAGLEGALEAAGVLDAWVTPEGELLAADTDDVLLRPGAAVPAHLGTVLRPVTDADDAQLNAVSGELVGVLLSSIGYGEQDVHSWVGADGRFRLGVLTGRWHKATATLIGRTARDAARRVRLAELREYAAAVEAQLAELGSAQQRLDERAAMLTREVADVPTDTALRKAQTVVLGLVAEQDRLAARQEVAKGKEIAAADAAAQTRSNLEAAAKDVGLPTDPQSLADIGTALGSYRIALVELWPALSAATDAARQMAEAAADLSAAEYTYAGLADRARVAEQLTTADSERYRTLQETVGAAVAELQRRLTETTELLRANQSESEAARAAVDGAIEARGVASGQLQTLAEQLDLAAERRAAAGESFRRFAGTGLLAVALPGLEIPEPGTPWAPIPAMRLARRVNDELGDVDDADTVWDRAQHRLNTELKTLQDTLSRHGNRASADLQEDGVVVEIEFQGRPATVAQLAEALGTEVADRERLLSEREREVLENHLVNEVASTLQELIAAAEAQVAAMNGELENRPTSTGMRLRLLWQPRPDGPAGLAVARERLLRQTSDAWAPEDRAAVGDFLQARIAEVRAQDTTGTWLEHLSAAMDYRAWNQFVIQRYQNGQWKSATGPASGGERVLAASVPLFAAASSHYSSAGNPYAPRLITLDEAFAGVDDNARAKYLGLLAAFDLDVVMTSEREWGCYPEVPGLAISQLARADGVPAVLVTNWEWDGRRRTRVDRDLRGADETADAETSQAGLWE